MMFTSKNPCAAVLLGFFERSSAYVVNHGDAPALDEGRCGAPSRGMGEEISRRWDAQTALDEVVAAIRSGDAKRALALAEGPAVEDLWPVGPFRFARLDGPIRTKRVARLRAAPS